MDSNISLCEQPECRTFKTISLGNYAVVSSFFFFFFPGKNAEIAGTAIFFRETYVSCLSDSIRLGLGVELGAVFFILCVCVRV